jgi:hypothetical protein
MSISIELGNVSVSECECCGKRSHTMRGFVSDDGAAYAVYFAGYTEGHREIMATLVVSLGAWCEGSTPDERECVVMKVRNHRGKIEMMVVGVADCPWDDLQILGRMLERREALESPTIADFFHVADHVIERDHRLRAYLIGERVRTTAHH